MFARGSGYSGDSDDSDSTTNERSALIRPSTSSNSAGGTFGAGPSTSTSATMERLQNAGASLVTQSDPSRPSTSSSLQHWDETSQNAVSQNFIWKFSAIFVFRQKNEQKNSKKY